jgi:sec-independent protein translocase protein TatB
MLNVGPFELLVVLAVALIVVGPERLPELARSVGRVLRQFRDVQNEVRDLVASEVDDDVRQAASDFKKVTGDLTQATDVKGAVRRAERTIKDETAKFRTPRSTPKAKPAAAAPSEPTAEPGHEPPAGEPTEAAGPPADRLVDDAGATPAPPAAPEADAPVTADEPETETPPDR